MADNAATMGGLQGRRVLVVEDDYFIASDIDQCLTNLGCEVVGPYPTVEDAVSSLETRAPDAAVLDVNVAGQAVYPLARTLIRRRIPTLFVTGYDEASISPRFRAVPRLTKPLMARELQKAMASLVAQVPPAPAPGRGER